MRTVEYDALDQHGRVVTLLAKHGRWVALTRGDEVVGVMMSIEDYDRYVSVVHSPDGQNIRGRGYGDGRAQ